MPFQLMADAFSSEAQAIEAIESAGMNVYAADVESNARDLHWHDFDALIGVVAGELHVTDESGDEFTCGPGSMLRVTDRPLHTERTSQGRFVFGFDVPYDQLEQPINRDPATHPSR